MQGSCCWVCPGHSINKGLRPLLISIIGRYLHIRLILFRPLLSTLLHSTSRDTPFEPDSSMENEMRQDILDKGVNLCISSARELVDLITGNLNTCNDILPPPWHNVFCMYELPFLRTICSWMNELDVHSCSIVFLICRLCCLDRIPNKDALIARWNKCLAFFHSYGSRSRSATRCLRSLEAVEASGFLPQACRSPNYIQAPEMDPLKLISYV